MVEAANRTGPTAVEKAKDRAEGTKSRFDALWKDIHYSADEHYDLNLRQTANLVGFCLFPVGWTWLEYPPNEAETEPPYEGKARRNDAGDMTRFLVKIDLIAREFDCAIVIVRHLRKSRNVGNAIDFGFGSIAIAGRERSSLLLGRHPEDGTKRAVALNKYNYSKGGPAILFDFVEGLNDHPRVRWLGTDETISAEDIATTRRYDQPGRPPKETDEAEDFLRQILSAGETDQRAVHRAAEEHPFSSASLRRARKRLQIQVCGVRGATHIGVSRSVHLDRVEADLDA